MSAEKHHLRDLYSDPDDLRMRIANYRQTRRTAARSMHRWLDALIADAEQRLCELTGPDDYRAVVDDGAAPGTVTVVAERQTKAAEEPSEPWQCARRTYPFDELAPRQRPDR